jgi:hypothetical protein
MCFGNPNSGIRAIVRQLDPWKIISLRFLPIFRKNNNHVRKSGGVQDY